MKKRVVAIRKKVQTDLSDPLIRADKLMAEAMGAIRLLGAATPRNAAQERTRLTAAFEANDANLPRWSYARTDHAQLVSMLERLALRLEEGEGEDAELSRIYAERAKELALEAKIAGSVGTPDIAAFARERFAPQTQLGAKVDELAREWAALTPDDAEEEFVMSDARDPRSLVVHMEEEIARLKLPFIVVVQPGLAALAATGDRHIYIAQGRKLTKKDVDRTVLHEIEAHAIPRGRAQLAKLGIFQIGTARGVDDQEGFAIMLEERHGFLTHARKRELGSRHVAAYAMNHGADFVEVAKMLHDTYGLPWARAIMMCERAFRGGNGKTPGLGRERVYLEAFGRVRAHLAQKPEDEAVLSAGQVSVDSIAALTQHA